MSEPTIDRILESVLVGDPAAPIPSFIREVEKREIGYLEIPSGDIVACDPLAFSHPVALVQRAPQGRYPVSLFIAHYENSDQRIAAALLEFASGLPKRWEMALLPEQEISQLKLDHYFGYPVDSGTGAFMDLSAARELDRRMCADDQYFQQIIDAMSENYVHTRDWALIDFDGANGLNAAVFSSGQGDGLYASYGGWNEERPLCLVTDFNLIFSEDRLVQ
jgi:hypothetical protein